MNASQILRADLLDIIFENRNKAYGAYVLRKLYDQHVLKSLCCVVFMITAFAYIVLSSKPPDLFSIRSNIPEHRSTMILDKVPFVKPKENPPTSKPAERMSNKFIFVDSLQLDSAIVEDDPQVSTNAGTNVSEPAYAGMQGGADGPSREIPPPAPEPPIAPVPDITKPVEKADIDPSYPGGLKALTRFLERNLENPEELGDGESISVKVKFVVGFDGELKAFEIKEDGGETFNREVIRVLKNMPRWIPGKTNGKNVSVYFTIPVKFINGQ